jgi:hypothetical protein
MITVEDFCNKFSACEDVVEWAMENCSDMNEVWLTAKPDWVIWIATRKGVLTDKELRLFAVFCARQDEHLFTDHRSINVIDVAERFAHGNATKDELNAARAAARAAASDAEWVAARAATKAAATASAYAGFADEVGAAKDAQAQWLRVNTKPNFKGNV